MTKTDLPVCDVRRLRMATRCLNRRVRKAGTCRAGLSNSWTRRESLSGEIDSGATRAFSACPSLHTHAGRSAAVVANTVEQGLLLKDGGNLFVGDTGASGVRGESKCPSLVGRLLSCRRPWSTPALKISIALWGWSPRCAPVDALLDSRCSLKGGNAGLGAQSCAPLGGDHERRAPWFPGTPASDRRRAAPADLVNPGLRDLHA